MMIQILMMSKLKIIWENQASSIKNEVIRERVESIPGLNCYVGTIAWSKAKIFLLELNASCPVHSNYLMRFVGVEIQVLPVDKGIKELAIVLLENELSDIFIFFIEDIINSLTNINIQEDAILIVSQKINYWKKLFSKYTREILTPQQQQGLFGELYFLKLMLDNLISSESVIRSWEAPSGKNQDFNFDGHAVEIKTSKSNSPSIRISNEYQLDTTGLKSIFIAFYNLTEYQGKEYTLLSIIMDIRTKLKSKPDVLTEFNTKLESLGITSDNETEYNTMALSVRDEKYYLVTPEFPKITTETIDDAISKISYEIDPNQCSDFEISFNSILKKLKNDYC